MVLNLGFNHSGYRRNCGDDLEFAIVTNILKPSEKYELSVLIEMPNLRCKEQVVKRYYSQKTGCPADCQLDTYDISQYAYKEYADHCYAPIHHIYAHNPAPMAIIRVGLKKCVAQCHPSSLSQPYWNKSNKGK